MLISRQHPPHPVPAHTGGGCHFPANRQKGPELHVSGQNNCMPGGGIGNVIHITSLILLPGPKPVKPFMIFLFFN